MSNTEYTIYRTAIDALKLELGYQDVRKRILTNTLPEGLFVLEKNFETKCRKMDREFFHEEWFPSVLKALQTHTCVVGTITSLPKKEGGEGHYMTIVFWKGRYSERTAHLFDPSNGEKNSVCVFATQLVKQHLESLLRYWKWRLVEIKTKYTCQISLYDSMHIPIHVDTYCQTWSMLLLIYFYKSPPLMSVYDFQEYDMDSLKKRHTIFVKQLREEILPHILQFELERTFKRLLLENGLTSECSAYDILSGARWNEYTYYFFRDTPYPF